MTLPRFNRIPTFLLTLISIAGILLVAPDLWAAQEPKKGFLRKMSDPPLPTELTENVDVFPMARVRTMRNPLTFKPYRVAKLKRGWMRTSSGVGTVPVDRRSVAGVGGMSSRQSYSFLMNESDQLQWFVGCKWDAAKASIVYSGRTTSMEMPASGTVHLQCEIGKPEDSPLWGLLMDAEYDGSKGLAGSAKVAGELLGPVNRYSITLLYAVEGSRVLGDIPAGFLFLDGETPVAAMQMSGWNAPLRFTVSRSVVQEERSVIAAAAAALVLQEEMPDFDD